MFHEIDARNLRTLRGNCRNNSAAEVYYFSLAMSHESTNTVPLLFRIYEPLFDPGSTLLWYLNFTLLVANGIHIHGKWNQSRLIHNEDISNSISIFAFSSIELIVYLTSSRIKLWKNTSERAVIILLFSLSLSLLNSPTFPRYRSSKKLDKTCYNFSWNSFEADRWKNFDENSRDCQWFWLARNTNISSLENICRTIIIFLVIILYRFCSTVCSIAAFQPVN